MMSELYLRRELPVLNAKCEKFDFSDDTFNPSELARGLVDLMYSSNALALAANQCGVLKRVFVMRGPEKAYAFFNPIFADVSGDMILDYEACPNFPDLSYKIKRHENVRLRFQGIDGNTYTEQFTGLSARYAQQAMDFLDGVVFYERANRFHREQASKKKAKLLRIKKEIAENETQRKSA